MPIKQSELNQKWYSKSAKIFFWSVQVLVVIAIISRGGGIVDLVLCLALYGVVLIGIWKVIIYFTHGKIEKDNNAKNNAIKENKKDSRTD